MLPKSKNEKKFNFLESKIWNLTNIPKKHISHKKANLKNNSFINYTEIDLIKRHEKKTLILLHGYTCTKSVFFKLANFLYKNFHLLILDLPGMNFNHKKTKLPFFDLNSTLDFFINEIENFVQVLELEKFDLLGHSLGGFIAGHYFDRFPEKIGKIYFLSPAGFHKSLKNQKSVTEKKMKKLNLFFAFYLKMIGNGIFKEKKSFFEIFPKYIMKKIIKKYYSQKIFNLTKKESFLLTKLINCLIDEKQYGEKGLSYLLHFSVKSPKPLFEILKKFPEKQKNMIFIYGEKDWMDGKKSVNSIVTNNFMCKFYFLKNSGHFVIVQNPDKLSEVILSFSEGSFEGEGGILPKL